MDPDDEEDVESRENLGVEDISNDFAFTLPARTTLEPPNFEGVDSEKAHFTTVGAFQRQQANKPPLLLVRASGEETTRRHLFKEEDEESQIVEYNALE
ncbi:unnamed protein product [Sphagnum tenellum]